MNGGNTPKQIVPDPSWIEGRTVTEIFPNLLKSLLWAKDNVGDDDYMYGVTHTLDKEQAGLRLMCFDLSRRQIASRDATEYVLNVETVFQRSSETKRYTSRSTLAVNADGSMFGTATLKQGGAECITYGLRVVDGEHTWCVLAESIWTKRNDIKEGTLPTTKVGLATAIRGYFTNLCGKMEASERALAQKLEMCVYNATSLERVVLRNPNDSVWDQIDQIKWTALSEKDIYVFNQLVRYDNGEIEPPSKFYDEDEDYEFLRGALEFVESLYAA